MERLTSDLFDSDGKLKSKVDLVVSIFNGTDLLMTVATDVQNSRKRWLNMLFKYEHEVSNK